MKSKKKIFKEYGLKWAIALNHFKKKNNSSFLRDYYEFFINNLSKRFNGCDVYINLKKTIINNTPDITFLIINTYINNLVSKKISKYDEVIDLGAGIGDRSLLLSYLLKKNMKYLLGELTPEGTKTQKYLIEKYNFKNFKTFNFDFFGKNKYNFHLKKPIFITSYAIEQLTYLNDDFYISLKKRFNLKKLDILHIEPVGFQFKKSIFQESNKKYNLENNYNLNLANVIKKTKVKKLEVSPYAYTFATKNKRKSISSSPAIVYLSI